MSNEKGEHHEKRSIQQQSRSGEKRYWIGVDGAGNVHIRSWDSTEYVSLSRRQFIAIMGAVACADQQVANYIGTVKQVDATLVKTSNGNVYEISPDLG